MKKLKIKGLGWIITLVVVLAIAITVISIKGWNADGITFFFKTILLDNFLAVNAILLGTLTFVGYMLLRRGFSESLIGALKTMVGVLLLTIGSGALISLAKPIFTGLTHVTSSKIQPLDPYLGWSSANDFLTNGISSGAQYVSWVSFVLIGAFAFNIILVVLKRWTNVHSLMLTGHVMFQQCAIITALTYMFLFREQGGPTVGSQVGTIVMASLFIGTYWGVGSTATYKGAQKVTNNSGFTIGHQQMYTLCFAYKIGKFFGKAEDSAETKKVSQRFKIFEDNIFTQICIISTLFLILIIIIKFGTHEGWDPLAKGSMYASWNVAGEEGTYWVINALLGSLKAIAAILALASGVRMFVTELQQAFQGISSKLIPGAVVAVDCPALYGFASNAVTYGFLSGVISQFASVGVIIGLSIATHGAFSIVVPLFVVLFFNFGTIGVYANASGGYKACLIVPAIFGFLELFIASGTMSVIQATFDKGVAAGEFVGKSSPIATGYIGMTDWNTIFGLDFILAGQHKVFAWAAFGTTIVAGLVAAQIIDSAAQTKKTGLQRIFKLNPKLITEVKSE